MDIYYGNIILNNMNLNIFIINNNQKNKASFYINV